MKDRYLIFFIIYGYIQGCFYAAVINKILVGGV